MAGRASFGQAKLVFQYLEQVTYCVSVRPRSRLCHGVIVALASVLVVAPLLTREWRLNTVRTTADVAHPVELVYQIIANRDTSLSIVDLRSKVTRLALFFKVQTEFPKGIFRLRGRVESATPQCGREWRGSCHARARILDEEKLLPERTIALLHT